MRGATERRSRDDTDHAPVEHPERSGPETLHDILTRSHVNSSDYSEDGFKVVLSFVNWKHVSTLRLRPPHSDPADQQGVSEEEQDCFRDGYRGECGQVRQTGHDGEYHPDAGGGVEGVDQ